MKIATQNRQILRLFKYLIDLETKEDVCVFIRFSGHVNNFEIQISASEEDYNSTLYDTSIDYEAMVDKWDRSWIEGRNWKQCIDEVIAEIQEAVDNRANKLAELKEEQEKEERVTFERLKAKFEG